MSSILKEITLPSNMRPLIKKNLLFTYSYSIIILENYAKILKKKEKEHIIVVTCLNTITLPINYIAICNFKGIFGKMMNLELAHTYSCYSEMIYGNSLI